MGLGLSSGCGRPERSDPAPTPTATATPTPAPLTSGQLVGGTGAYPGTIAGVRFRTATESGVTNADGVFTYHVGETVTFSVADVDFRAVDGASMVSPWQLTAAGACEQSESLARGLALLFSLDADGDPANGIAVVEAESGSSQRDFSTLDDAAVAALIDQLIPGRTPMDAAAATHAFITQMDGELWSESGLDTFSGTTALVRSQGVATDGTSWFFSWTKGLERDDLDFNAQESNLFAIPAEQAALGDDHIGDIDYANGTLWVPLEDGGPYDYPFLAAYDPVSLTATSVYPLSNTLLTEGVPWVAADGPRARLYVAEWDPTPQILVYDMATVTFQKAIDLSVPVGRIQGGKVFEGSLYLSSDNANMDLYKVNLETGTVIPLFTISQGNENEGLAFLELADGSVLHTMTVNGAGVDFRHHRRDRAPLRQSVCPGP